MNKNSIKKVCLIVNYNLYESKRYFTQKLSEAMQRFDIETKIIDVREGALGADSVAAIKRFDPDFTCSFNSLLPISEKKFLWDYLEIPHVSFLVDPAFYSTNLIDSPYSILTCVDRSDDAVIKSSGFQNVFFWPHAVEKELSFDESQERPFDVVFMGSCYDYESLRASWKQRNPESINKVLDSAIEEVFSNDRVALSEALAKAWGASGLDPAGVDFPALYYYLDNYTRGRDRVELIRSIKKTPVHIFGELSTDNAVGVLGWAQYLGGQSNVKLHPSVPFHEMLDILKQSKITLNSMPFFRDGTHERIFAGLACGAFPVTSESQYLREQFQEGQELLFYQSKNKSNISDEIEHLLQNENKRKQGISSGRQKVMQNHTWDKRTEELIKEVHPILNRIKALNSR